MNLLDQNNLMVWQNCLNIMQPAVRAKFYINIEENMYVVNFWYHLSSKVNFVIPHFQFFLHLVRIIRK